MHNTRVITTHTFPCLIHKLFGFEVPSTHMVNKHTTYIVDGVEEEHFWYEAYVCEACIKMAENVDSGLLNVLSHAAYLYDKYEYHDVFAALDSVTDYPNTIKKSQ